MLNIRFIGDGTQFSLDGRFFLPIVNEIGGKKLSSAMSLSLLHNDGRLTNGSSITIITGASGKNPMTTSGKLTWDMPAAFRGFAPSSLRRNGQPRHANV